MPLIFAEMCHSVSWGMKYEVILAFVVQELPGHVLGFELGLLCILLTEWLANVFILPELYQAGIKRFSL